jgi:hypothetical protein
VDPESFGKDGGRQTRGQREQCRVARGPAGDPEGLEAIAEAIRAEMRS